MLKQLPILTTESHFCPLPFKKIIMNGWGDVSMCCHQRNQLGSLLKDDVLTIWNSDIAKSVREQTSEGKLHSICSSWNSCPFLVAPKVLSKFDVWKYYRYPRILEICLPNSHCNIGGENPNDDNPACIMCCRNFNFEAQPQITDLLIEKAKPLLPYLESLCVMGIAEPFWKDVVFEIFDRLNFQNFKNSITFFTNHNGICFNNRAQQKLKDITERTSLQWSLDAATPMTYRKIRRLNCYKMIINNMKKWIQQVDPVYHENTIYNNINLLNVDEMSKMVECAADLGVRKMYMLPTGNQMGRVHLDEILLNKKNLDIFIEESNKALEKAKELGVDLVYTKPFHIPPPEHNLVQIGI